MNRIFMGILLVAVLLALGTPTVASAGCTANLSCPNGCFLSLWCPVPPYSQSWYISCSLPDQYLQCSGQNSCTVGSGFIECDGHRQTCAPYGCYQGTDYLRCGTTSASCSACESSPFSCPN